MLKITEDDARDLFLLEPSGTLEKADFDRLTEKVDARVAAGRPVPNLVIHARAFPGWADFAAFSGHLRFLRSNESRIEKIALVSDSGILDIAPKIARHFVAARLRHFPEDELAQAQDWAAVRDDEPPHVTLIEGLPDDTLGISVRGILGARDYTEVIIPAVEAKLAGRNRIKLLCQIGPEFETMTAGAVWNDTRLGVTHLTSFSKIALVTDINWMRGAARVFAPLVPADIHVFRNRELEAAKAWIAAPAGPGFTKDESPVTSR
jgi:hypothetical protein